MKYLLTPVNDRYPLTQVSLISNIDGAHTQTTVIGYIALPAFTVLSAMLTTHVISWYNDPLYPSCMVPGKYSLSIRNVGSMYSYHTTSLRPIYTDIISFASNSGDLLERAQINTNTKDEYLGILVNIKANNHTIQKAINAQKILREVDIDENATDLVEYVKTKCERLLEFLSSDNELNGIVHYALSWIMTKFTNMTLNEVPQISKELLKTDEL
jgi:hypothetical protein